MTASPPSRDDAQQAVTVRTRTAVWSNSVFTVYSDCLERQDGSQVADYMSIVPKSLAAGGIGGVAVLPEVDGRYGLIRVHRHPLGSTAWEVPRGFVDPQESTQAAALRELQEEIALQTTAAHLVPLGIVAPEPGVLAARVQVYAALRCRHVAGDATKELGHTRTGFFTLDEIGHLIEQQEIIDPFTLVAYYRHRLSVGTAEAAQ